MSKQRVLGLIIVCISVVVLSLVGLASAFVTRILFTLDGLLLLMICLMMAGIFALMLLSIAREQGWLAALSKKRAPSPAPPGARVGQAASAADAVQPNQATHPVDQAASRPQMQPGPAKAGEGK